MTTADRTERICGWMGWRVHERNTACWVRGSDPRPVASTCGVDRFDPFTKAEHCAVVMEAADKSGWYSVVEARGSQRYDALVVVDYGSGSSYPGHGASRWEAFCNAFLAAVEAGHARPG